MKAAKDKVYYQDIRLWQVKQGAARPRFERNIHGDTRKRENERLHPEGQQFDGTSATKERGEKRQHISFDASFVEQKHQNPSLKPFLVSELAV